MKSFADEVYSRTSKLGPLVIGIDPHLKLLPSFLSPQKSSEIPLAIRSFFELTIAAATERVLAVKIQSAFFEQLGSIGIKLLAECIATAKSHGLLTILDIKRGDIGSTAAAYAQAYLSGGLTLPSGETFTSDLAVDCVTVSPYLGFESIEPWLPPVMKEGRGIFVLIRTSNPGAQAIQGSCFRADDNSSASCLLAKMLAERAAGSTSESNYSSVGAVVGATLGDEIRALRQLMPQNLFLVPGLGAQGGDLSQARAAQDSSGQGALYPISRGVTFPWTAAGSEFSPPGTAKEYEGLILERINHYQSQLKR